MADEYVKKINELAEDPHSAGNVKSLHGALIGLYRLRSGDYRVLYSIKDEALLILVLEVGNRKDIYR